MSARIKMSFRQVYRLVVRPRCIGSRRTRTQVQILSSRPELLGVTQNVPFWFVPELTAWYWVVGERLWRNYPRRLCLSCRPVARNGGRLARKSVECFFNNSNNSNVNNNHRFSHCLPVSLCATPWSRGRTIGTKPCFPARVVYIHLPCPPWTPLRFPIIRLP